MAPLKPQLWSWPAPSFKPGFRMTVPHVERQHPVLDLLWYDRASELSAYCTKFYVWKNVVITFKYKFRHRETLYPMFLSFRLHTHLFPPYIFCYLVSNFLLNRFLWNVFFKKLIWICYFFIAHTLNKWNEL